MARVSLCPIREYGGEIFTDYYFGEANTANNSDNLHNNAINKNLNWGGISGLLQLATTNSGSRPEIQDDPGGKGRGGKRETTKNSTPPTVTRLHVNDELLTRNFRKETTTSKDEAIETSKGGTAIQTDDQGKHSHSKW